MSLPPSQTLAPYPPAHGCDSVLDSHCALACPSFGEVRARYDGDRPRSDWKAWRCYVSLSTPGLEPRLEPWSLGGCIGVLLCYSGSLRHQDSNPVRDRRVMHSTPTV